MIVPTFSLDFVGDSEVVEANASFSRDSEHEREAVRIDVLKSNDPLFLFLEPLLSDVSRRLFVG